MSFSVHQFYEFFAGGGMARAGLGDDAWNCLFANDFDHKKGRIYEANWGKGVLEVKDVGLLSPQDLPGLADLVWASFPCQDLSLAGGGAGLKGNRSGTFWPFWRLMHRLKEEGRSPRMIVLENVCGTLTSHQGKDFASICETFREAGYRFGALIIDAALFVPQSRPRLFMIGVRDDIQIPESLTGAGANAQWHPRSLRTAFDKLPREDQKSWIWWRIPPPPLLDKRFADLIEDEPASIPWDTPEKTKALLDMMSSLNQAKVEAAKSSGQRMVGTIYKRTRADENGRKVQRAEVRFDDIAGCLRTPAGGSSRQVILLVQGCDVKSRLISSRETARLMGLPETYVLPPNYNEAYHLTGDGVAVPVVRHLAEYLIEPLITDAKLSALVSA
jgi:DNA (cytosine-5)-methyltransferase 1